MQTNKGINFDCMPCKYWDNSTKISYLQRRIIVYSIMYYEMDESCISDKQYDDISRQLVHLQSSVSEAEWKKSTYYYAMYDFDGSTGFDIPSRLNKKDREYLSRIAQLVYNQWKYGTNTKKEAKLNANDERFRV